jgi:hypothetical protein
VRHASSSFHFFVSLIDDAGKFAGKADTLNVEGINARSLLIQEKPAQFISSF